MKHALLNPSMNSTFSKRTLLASAFSLLLAGAALAQPQYTVTDLGVLPGYDTSVATGLNDQGDVVGYCMGPSDSYGSAVVWRNGSAPVNLGKLLGGNES